MDVSVSQNKDKRVITYKEILHLQSLVYTLDYFRNVLLTVIRVMQWNILQLLQKIIKAKMILVKLKQMSVNISWEHVLESDEFKASP